MKMEPMTIHNQIAKRFYTSCNEMALTYLLAGMRDRNREWRAEVYRELFAKYHSETVLRHADTIAKILAQIEEHAWHEEIVRWLDM